MNGYITLSIVALLFLSIYLYSYYPVFAEKYRRKRLLVKKRQMQLAFKEQRQKRAQARREKYAKFKQRSLEIRQELVRLHKMRNLQHH